MEGKLPRQYGAQATGCAPIVRLAERALLRPDDEVVLCLTGHGLKTVEAVQDTLLDAPAIAPKVREVAALVSTCAA